MADAKVQREINGRVNRARGHVVMATPGDTMCCCVGNVQWVSMLPCNVNTNGWWVCPLGDVDPAYYAQCKWVRWDVAQQLIADYGCDVASGQTGDVVVYESASDACYLLPGQGASILFLFGNSIPPSGGFDATDTITPLGCSNCCDFCSCPADIPDPPTDPPPALPPPASCPDCGVVGFCTYCDCTPDHGIRVTITGWTPCVCVGPCDGSTYTWSKLKDGDTFNGTFDLTRTADCIFEAVVGRTVVFGAPADTELKCNVDSINAFTLRLQKISTTQWAFAIFVTDPLPTDPRLEDPASDFQQWRAFNGVFSVPVNECMTIGAMTNTMTCGCRSTATSDGRFDIGHGGIATFTILCA